MKEANRWGAVLMTVLAFAACATPTAETAPANEPVQTWSDARAHELRAFLADDVAIAPERFRLVRLDAAALDAILETATTDPDAEPPVVLHLPQPRGGYERFRIWRTQTMSPGLEAQMAELGWRMRTYAGASLDRPGVTLSLDWGGPRGLHAAVLAPGESYYLDPRFKGDTRYYASYYKTDLPPRPMTPSSPDYY